MKLLTTTIFAGLAFSSAALAQEGIGGDRWTGFYAGVLGGASTGKTDGMGDQSLKGLDATLLAGYRVGYGDLVVGAEANVTLSSFGFDIPFARFKTSPGASLRAVVGLPVGRFMPFVSAGVDYTSGTLTLEEFDFSMPGLVISDVNRGHWGGSVGVGAEWALTQTLTARAEYRYTSFGNETYSFASGSIPDIALQRHSFLTGLVMKF